MLGFKSKALSLTAAASLLLTASAGLGGTALEKTPIVDRSEMFTMVYYGK